FREARRDVNSRLLVPHKNVRKIRILLERLSDSRDIAMAENPQGTRKERMLFVIALDVLIFKKRNERLGGSQSSCFRHYFLSGSGSMKSRTSPSNSAYDAMNARSVRTV